MEENGESIREVWEDYHATRSPAAFDALVAHYLPLVEKERDVFHAACRSLDAGLLYDAALDALFYSIGRFRYGDFAPYVRRLIRLRMIRAARAQRRSRIGERLLSVEMFDRVKFNGRTTSLVGELDCDEDAKRKLSVREIAIYYLAFHAAHTQHEISALLGLRTNEVLRSLDTIRSSLRGSHIPSALQ